MIEKSNEEKKAPTKKLNEKKNKSKFCDMCAHTHDAVLDLVLGSTSY